MKNTTRREAKMPSKIEKPKRMFMSWKTIVPAVAALGVGGLFFRSRRAASELERSGGQAKQ